MRSAALIVMGLVQYNYAADLSLAADCWALLSHVCILCAWCAIPKVEGCRRVFFIGLKCIGILGLITLFAIFRREPTPAQLLFRGEVDGWIWLQTGWWGILGLIGWAYLVAALTYLWLGRRREWLMGGVGLLMLCYLADRSGGFFTHVDSKNWLGILRPIVDAAGAVMSTIDQYVDIGGTLGSQAAITVSGCLLGSILVPGADIQTHRDRIRWSLTFSVLLCFAGFATDHVAGVNKISATPTWCFWCSAITTWIWLLVYVIMDVRKQKRWFAWLMPTGANPLIAYLLHPILVWCLSLIGLSTQLLAYKLSESVWIVMGGSLVMAIGICLLTQVVAKLGLRVKI